MSNLNGMGPFNDPNWVCFKKTGGGGFGRGCGRGGNRRFNNGAGAGYRAAFQGGYASGPRTVDAGVDRSSEINELKEKIASLEEIINGMKNEKGDL